MPYQVTCPNCHAKYSIAKPVPQGPKAKCRKCGTIFEPTTIPESANNHSSDTVAYSPPAHDSAGQTTCAEDPNLGRTIGGCRIQTKLGEGGMGTVYKAHHLALDIPVAIKLLSPHFSDSPNSTWGDRLIREARAAAKLQHQNIVGVLNVGREDNLHFIIMQYIAGPSLQKLIYQSGAIPIAESIAIIGQVCKALALAHKNNIIHRDIKPDNLMLDAHGAVKLADLGLARDITDNNSMTASGISMGTPYYMAPEQAADARKADHRSDIYSLGCTWYHLITGLVPYEGESGFTVLTKHANDPVPDPRQANPNIPLPLAAVIRKMMAKKPADRYQNIEELQTDIHRIEAGITPAAPLAPPPPESAETRIPGKKSNLGWFVAGGLATILLLVLLGAAAKRIYNKKSTTLTPTPIPTQPPPEPRKAPRTEFSQRERERLMEMRKDITREVFLQIDGNHDKKIDREELSRLPESRRNLLNHADTDKDGQITEQEWNRFLFRLRSMRRRPRDREQ